MPLSTRTDYQDARFVGLALTSVDLLRKQVSELARPIGFDFLITPLARTPDRRAADVGKKDHLEFGREDMVSFDDEWHNKLVGLVSPWIDPDSSDVELRRDSAAAFKMEVQWAKFLGMQAVVLPPPFDTSRVTGYAHVRLSHPAATHRAASSQTHDLTYRLMSGQHAVS
jgi:type II protein arginine methyltransferase